MIDLRQLNDGLGLDVLSGTPRNIINQDGQFGVLGDGFKMGQHPVHGRLVVVGAHLQGGVGPRFLGVPGHHDRFLGAVRARAGDYRHPSPGFLDGDLDDLIVFFVVQGGGFAGGPAGDQAVHLFFFNEVIDQTTQPVHIQGKIVLKGRYERDMASGKIGKGHNTPPICFKFINNLKIVTKSVIPAALLSGNPGFSWNAGSPTKAFGDDEKLPH